MSERAAASVLTIDVNRTGATPVVRCGGRLVMGQNDRFYDCIRELMPEHKRVVLDFTELIRMDSTGLGTLVRVYVHAKAAGCSLEMKNVGPQIKHLLGITNLWSSLTIVGENNIKLP